MPPKVTLPRTVDVTKLKASICRDSFWDFVRAFWTSVPGAGEPIWNWHMRYLCEELQAIGLRVFRGEPNDYDLVINIAPGTSKSMICSVLFQPWTWTFMPHARHVNASHTSELVLDLANKARDVIRSKKYQSYYPDVQLRTDMDAKGYYANTAGGMRFSCTVSGKTPTGFHGHFQCLPYSSLVTTEIGNIPIGDLVEKNIQTRVLSFNHETGKTEWNEIEDRGHSPGRSMCKVVLDDGNTLDCTTNHPVYVFGRGYINAIELKKGDKVCYEKGCTSSLLHLWRNDRENSRSCSSEERASVLSRLPVSEVIRRQPSQVYGEESNYLCCVSEEFRGREEEFYEKVLQLPMQGTWYERSEQSILETESRNWLRLLWGCNSAFTVSVEQHKVLFKRMCERFSFGENDRERKPQLHSRQWLQRLYSRFLEGSSKDQAKRSALLCNLRNDEGREWEEFGCSSYRLGQAEQQQEQPGFPLPFLSSRNARRNEQTFNVGASAVQEIKQIVWVPEKVYNLEVEKLHNYFASGILVHNSVDDPLDPQKALSEVELKTAENFMTQVLPSRKTDKAVSTTILIQQRVHHLDPTGVLLEIAKKEFSRKLRHVCLPAELTPDISPPLEELQKKYPEAYVEGLMDPVRMTKAVLQDFKSKMSSAGYEGQFLQKPIPPGGQMFRPEYFNLRVKSAPYNCTRIRYTDRASTPDGGCRTAMVLLAKDLEGNYYVEHVEVGQWEPRERNRRLRALALRDRARYPNNEPLYLIEREGGSSGRDAWLAVAKALEGFKFQEDTVTGDKTTRAEPWSSQLASGNVYIVDDGTWDVNDYIREHVLFPMHELKDLVDASSGAFNRLVGRTAQSTFRILSGIEGPKGKPFLWSCTREELSNLTDDRSCLLVFVKDPLCDDIPGHALRTLDTLVITATDIQPKDYQDKWTEEIPKYGKKPEDLHFTREQAKKVWSFLMKRRSANATYYVFAGDSQDLVLSMSLGVAAGLGLKAKDSVHMQSRPDNKLEDVAPNQHVYEVMKSTRGAVM